MSRKKECCDCGRALKKDEVALTRKLIDVDTEEFYCLDCLSEFLGCTVQDLKEKIQEFKEQGCTLFL
jgi:biotin operon repressor